MNGKPSIRPHSLAAWLAFMRPATFWIAAAPVCVGTALACALTGKFNFWVFFLTLFGAVLIQAMSNMVNDYAYNVRKAETGSRVGLPRATTEGWVSMSAAKKMILLVIVLCVLIAGLLIWLGGIPIALIAFFSILAGYCYMAGPCPIAYTPFGEFLVFVFYGLVAVCGTYWLQTANFDWSVFALGASLGLFGAAVLFVNNYRDVDHDIAGGRKTLVAYVGKKYSILAYACMIYLPFVVVGWVVPFHANFFPLLIVIVALMRASMLPRQLKLATPETTTKVMLQTIRLELIFSCLLTLSALVVFYMSWPDGTISSASMFVCPFK